MSGPQDFFVFSLLSKSKTVHSDTTNSHELKEKLSQSAKISESGFLQALVKLVQNLSLIPLTKSTILSCELINLSKALDLLLP